MPHVLRSSLRLLPACLVVLCSLAAPAVAQQVQSVEAGPLWNNADATNKCPKLCVAPSQWNGQWRTTVPGKMSTCDCVAPPPPRSVDAGPLWSNADATNKCPKVCAPGTWNGQWRTTVPGKMSTCDCVGAAPAPPAPVTPAPAPVTPAPAAGPVQSVNAGPLWNNADANAKCPALCVAPSKWNGQWRTTVPGKMSTCDCVAPQVQSVDAGPLWSNADATNKCPKVCAPGTWNGQWRTTVPGKMSTCDCLR